MPKGKRKDKFPNEYPDDDEDARAERETRAAAPQAKPHKRGGIHRVKEDKLTGTKWDHASRAVMVNAAQGRDAHGEGDPEFQKYIEFFEKHKAGKTRIRDLKKEVLLQTLAEAEMELRRRARYEHKEAERLEKEAQRKRKEEEEKRQEEEQRQKEEKKRKRNAEELVTDSEGEETNATRGESSKQLQLQQIEQQPEQYEVYDDSGSSDTSNTTTTQATDSPTLPRPKLRMFEWWLPELPSSDYRRTPRTWPENEEIQPKKLAYVPMHVISTITKEVLRLPGRNYKIHEKEPDSVPRLSERVKDCARNGVLIGKLSGARIESGRNWAKRTLVQGWNGRMYFELPAVTERAAETTERNERDLATVYREWKRNRRTARKAYSGVQKTDPRLKKFRAQQQRDLLKDVYETSQWRPTLVGFSPAYLAALGENGKAEGDDIKTLFYIILKDEKLPSFFFWADEDEWANPVVPNPEFLNYEEAQLRRSSNRSSSSRLSSQAGRSPWRRLSSFSRQSMFLRVKKTPTPRKFLPTTKIPKTSRYKAAVWAIERDLYNHGYAATLQKYQQKWAGEGNLEAWTALTMILRQQLPPSGFPSQPPIRDGRDPNMISVAEKMARVDAPSASRPILPIFVQDDWTRDDDAYWTTQERPIPTTPIDEDVDMQVSPYPRRSSTSSSPAPQYLSRRISDVFTWLSRVSSPANYPLYSAPPDQRLHHERNLALRVMADQLPTRIPQWELWRMMQERYQYQRQAPWLCAICLQELGDVPLEDYEQHLINHMVRIARCCPFCEISWEGLDGQDKADHVMRHRPTKDGNVLARRRVTQTPPELQGWAAVPQGGRRQRRSQGRSGGGDYPSSITPSPTPITPPGLQGRVAVPGNRGSISIPDPKVSVSPSSSSKNRKPSVRFSPTTVGQRVAYNGSGEAGQTSIKARRNGPRKSSLRIETDQTGRRTLNLYVDDREKAAHDPRRKSSEDSMQGRDRRMELYTYFDHGGDGGDDDGSGHGRREARGGRGKGNETPPRTGGKTVPGRSPGRGVYDVDGEDGGHHSEEGGAGGVRGDAGGVRGDAGGVRGDAGGVRGDAGGVGDSEEDNKHDGARDDDENSDDSDEDKDSDEDDDSDEDSESDDGGDEGAVEDVEEYSSSGYKTSEASSSSASSRRPRPKPTRRSDQIKTTAKKPQPGGDNDDDDSSSEEEEDDEAEAEADNDDESVNDNAGGNNNEGGIDNEGGNNNEGENDNEGGNDNEGEEEESSEPVTRRSTRINERDAKREAERKAKEAEEGEASTESENPKKEKKKKETGLGAGKIFPPPGGNPPSDFFENDDDDSSTASEKGKKEKKEKKQTGIGAGKSLPPPGKGVSPPSSLFSSDNDTNDSSDDSSDAERVIHDDGSLAAAEARARLARRRRERAQGGRRVRPQQVDEEEDEDEYRDEEDEEPPADEESSGEYEPGETEPSDLDRRDEDGEGDGDEESYDEQYYKEKHEGKKKAKEDIDEDEESNQDDEGNSDSCESKEEAEANDDEENGPYPPLPAFDPTLQLNLPILAPMSTFGTHLVQRPRRSLPFPRTGGRNDGSGTPPPRKRARSMNHGGSQRRVGFIDADLWDIAEREMLRRRGQSRSSSGHAGSPSGPPKCCEHAGCPCLRSPGTSEKQHRRVGGGGGSGSRGGGGGDDDPDDWDDDSGSDEFRPRKSITPKSPSRKRKSPSGSSGDKDTSGEDEESSERRRKNRKSTSSSGSSSAFDPDPYPTASNRRPPEWPVPVPLWYYLNRNPEADPEDDVEVPERDIEELEAELEAEEAAIRAAKKATRTQHTPKYQEAPAGPSTPSSAQRSTAPSSTASLAQAGLQRRSVSAPPNTPHPNIGDNIPSTGDEPLSRPASPGELTERISGVKTTRNGTSWERASTEAPGAARPRTPKSSTPSASKKRPSTSSQGSNISAAVKKDRTSTKGRKKVVESDEDEDEHEVVEPSAGSSERESSSGKRKKKPASKEVIWKASEESHEEEDAEEPADEASKAVEDDDDEEEEEEGYVPSPKRKKPLKTGAKKQTKQAKQGAKKKADQAKQPVNEKGATKAKDDCGGETGR
ncbi:hypothetical protein BU23DRAFT_597650 [Bimuria novae-zelandiae CBS 107.79]|uniref:Uncharacterized protein n=1 Tax=Bimuria novae-zelandiae CBS 107.79 TaxID=1447943 RepID=A0A6A5VEB7_9PLEO|nr:hypothetical protein BU23DRAFT_597650 [Bimuria novae-zelandiae CBS 107.79]